mmetsp:Transcript_1839/g.4100  ORF Transcript_1839/g.4100 Transcript_1839/m.4100 type:complete len:255 (-) Transcript_1839:389-1153(-)
MAISSLSCFTYALPMRSNARAMIFQSVRHARPSSIAFLQSATQSSYFFCSNATAARLVSTAMFSGCALYAFVYHETASSNCFALYATFPLSLYQSDSPFGSSLKSSSVMAALRAASSAAFLFAASSSCFFLASSASSFSFRFRNSSSSAFWNMLGLLSRRSSCSSICTRWSLRCFPRAFGSVLSSLRMSGKSACTKYCERVWFLATKSSKSGRCSIFAMSLSPVPFIDAAMSAFTSSSPFWSMASPGSTPKPFL